MAKVLDENAAIKTKHQEAVFSLEQANQKISTLTQQVRTQVFLEFPRVFLLMFFLRLNNPKPNWPTKLLQRLNVPKPKNKLFKLWKNLSKNYKRKIKLSKRKK